MAMNTVQFQPGLSMMAFMERYGSDDKCELALVASRWPDGFVCPACSCWREAMKTPSFSCLAAVDVCRGQQSGTNPLSPLSGQGRRARPGNR